MANANEGSTNPHTIAAMSPRRRSPLPLLLKSGGLGLVALIATVLVEVAIASRVVRLDGFTREELGLTLGKGGDPLRVTWIGDSTSAGVGSSSPQKSLPALIGQELGVPVQLNVLSVSGATTAEAIADQLPLLAETDPDWVFVAIGNNDVTRLTSVRAFSDGLQVLLRGVKAVDPSRIVVLGIAEFGGTPLFKEPLRSLAGWRARRLDQVVRAVALQHGTTYVPIARMTGPGFAADPVGTHAVDQYHPSDSGYQLWADATLSTLRSEALIPRDPLAEVRMRHASVSNSHQ